MPRPHCHDHLISGRLPLNSDCVENTEARCSHRNRHRGRFFVRWLIRSTQIWNHRSTSIVLTNSRLSSPCVATAVLTHPRGTCTRRNFSRQNGCHRDGDIEGRYTNDGIYSNKWVIVLSSHVQVAWGAFRKCENNSQNDCLLEVFRRAPNLQEHPTCEKHRLFNDGGVLYIIFYCLDICESLDRMWIWINIVDSDILGWACCLHIFIQKP